MSITSPRHLIRQRNLQTLLDEAGGPSALGELLGNKSRKTHLSACAHGHRGIGDDLAAQLERVMDRPSGWMDQDHTTDGGGIGAALNTYTVPPLVQLAELVKTVVVPDVFRAALQDDSLAPDHPRGVEFIWSSRQPARVGGIVLVRDRSGALHAREYRQGRAPAEWIAAPVNRAYAEFTSTEVTLVAVAQYRAV